MNEYYVYQLRLEGSNEPFYIGKGKGRRAWDHLTDKSNSYKARKIRKALSEGIEVLVEIVVDGLTEEQALRIEVWTIKMWGRKDIGEGPLTNLTDGGEGTSGAKFKLSEDQKRKMSERAKKQNARPPSNKGRKMSDEQKKKISDSTKGIPRPWKSGKRGPMTEEQRKKISEAKIGEKHQYFGKKRDLVVCPHCGKVGGQGIMGRWHFDNCRLKQA